MTWERGRSGILSIKLWSVRTWKTSLRNKPTKTSNSSIFCSFQSSLQIHWLIKKKSVGHKINLCPTQLPSAPNFLCFFCFLSPFSLGDFCPILWNPHIFHQFISHPSAYPRSIIQDLVCWLTSEASHHTLTWILTPISFCPFSTVWLGCSPLLSSTCPGSQHSLEVFKISSFQNLVLVKLCLLVPVHSKLISSF